MPLHNVDKTNIYKKKTIIKLYRKSNNVNILKQNARL